MEVITAEIAQRTSSHTNGGPTRAQKGHKRAQRPGPKHGAQGPAQAGRPKVPSWRQGPFKTRRFWPRLIVAHCGHTMRLWLRVWPDYPIFAIVSLGVCESFFRMWHPTFHPHILHCRTQSCFLQEKQSHIPLLPARGLHKELVSASYSHPTLGDQRGRHLLSTSSILFCIENRVIDC